jgi:hypothetical protein
MFPVAGGCPGVRGAALVLTPLPSQFSTKIKRRKAQSLEYEIYFVGKHLPTGRNLFGRNCSYFKRGPGRMENHFCEK